MSRSPILTSTRARYAAGWVGRSSTSLSARPVGNHPLGLALADEAVAVVVVHAKREEELVAVRPGDQRSCAGDELSAIDCAVAVAVESAQHPPSQVFASQAERTLPLAEESMRLSLPARCTNAFSRVAEET